MAQDSRLDRYEIFVATAAIGAHAGNPTAGFRYRDVKFLIELFSNWIETSLAEPILLIQNTQVARYITALVTEGYARKITRKGRPVFRLTRIGLIELITRITNRCYYYDREQFFFLYYFVGSYKPRLEKLVEQEGKQFPLALKLELESLLNTKSLVQKELAAAETERKKLASRIRDSEKTSLLVSKRLKEGADIQTITKEAEKLYPYELNSQKPLTQLISEIPEETRAWELQTGNLLRTSNIFNPSCCLLDAYIQELKKLLKDSS